MQTLKRFATLINGMTTRASAPYSIALFDIDGTLLDSNDAHADSWLEILRAERVPVEFEEIRALIGIRGDRLLSTVAGIDETSERGRRILNARTELFLQAYLPKLKPFAGTRELLSRMRADGYRLVVTGAVREDLLTGLISRAGVADFIDAVDMNAGPLRYAQAIVIGDTPFDLEAAKRAGLPAIGFLSGGWPAHSLRGALQIVEGPLELARNYDSSVLCRSGKFAPVNDFTFPL